MSGDDRIAVVGLAARVPGAADAVGLWRNLLRGVDSIRHYSAQELLRAGAPTTPDWVAAYGHLDHLTEFDAMLFGYPAEAAELLDPQHRLFLEVAWWALEDACVDPDRSDAQIGVFAGCAANRYLHHHLLGQPGLRPIAGELAEDWDDVLAGSGCDYLPARTAFALGLAGPAVAVQTACSTSLVAVCQAAQSLLDYRCDVAIAGGAAVVSTRQAGYRLRAGGLLAVDGVCRPYDAAATGQVFGNGAGAVVLKRLEDATTDGDRVYAVLTGWAVNNDGGDRAGFTVPAVAGQAAVVAEALAAVDWAAGDVGFIEGHGTGTAVGDAIEIEALARVRRRDPRPCLLGSLKANIGNLDAAAGVVSLIKAVYAVQQGQIPPTPHFVGANRDVDLSAAGLEVNTEVRAWSSPRRAAVSSFGLGGTNAHVLLEQAPANAPTPATDHGPAGWTALPLSAADPAALSELSASLAVVVAQSTPGEAAPALADMAHALGTGRRRLRHRGVLLVGEPVDSHGQRVVLAVSEPGGLPDSTAPELRSAAAGWLAGADLRSAPGRPITLPGYPFQRTRHWIEAIR